MYEITVMKAEGGICHYYAWGADVEKFRLWAVEQGHWITHISENTTFETLYRALIKERKYLFKNKWLRG